MRSEGLLTRRLTYSLVTSQTGLATTLDPWPDSPYTLLVAVRRRSVAESGELIIFDHCRRFPCRLRNRMTIFLWNFSR